MKKKLMILWGFVMIGCTAFGIVACGDNGGNNSSSASQSEQSSNIDSFSSETSDSSYESSFEGSNSSWESSNEESNTSYESSSEIHTHDYFQKVTAPTCTEKGYTMYTCSCGDAYVENYVDKLGHTYTETVTAPTCTEKGYTTYTCSCGYKYNANPVNKLGHKFETHPAKEATCTEIGWNTYVTCERDNCDYSTYQESPMLDHPIEQNWTINDTHHWYNTTCDCNLKMDFNEHTLDDSGWCAVCEQAVLPTEGIIYDVSVDGTYAEVIGYSGTSKRIKIAETYRGLPVKNIYDGAFENKNIISVIIPDGVTSIGDKAFYYCKSLTSITFGENSQLTSIGDRAFYYCKSLTSITFGENSQLTSIGDYAFYYCSSLTEIVIPDGVTSIGIRAFYNCDSLAFNEYGNCKYLGNDGNPYLALIEATNTAFKNYTIHENTKIIASYAFYSCGRLTEIVIPDKVTHIGNWAFGTCDNLTKIVLEDSNDWYWTTDFDEYINSQGGVLTSAKEILKKAPYSSYYFYKL